MGRKRAFTEEELLDKAEMLIIQHGYSGFHLKLLASHLPGARSTIYQYYANKEEIAAACMKKAMVRALIKAGYVDETDPIEALKQLLRVYMEEADLHYFLGDARKIDVSQSKKAEQNVGEVLAMLKHLRGQLDLLFDRAQKQGTIRSDLPISVMAGLFFQLINTPNTLQLPPHEWADYLFTLWYEGSGAY
ncbi:TetR/AcrR family transcriptional regulator [Domibacillus aminovorans]|uniref:TetR family transcriptional regulator n=1 Tax=Domibacillus aminovorans TaxID=29332 RepID=A0A177L3W0_9BACI|nr:TetR/AcrR family transcriptional regulator [Domibacillus aminovorans]OAH60233.1 TetR family transcriptional regulator [Domibacillus aminovorans]